MGCNKCGKKTLNNLDVPAYINMAVMIWEEVKNLKEEEITDDMWNEMYGVYNILFPRSNGQPGKSELLVIIHKATEYNVKYK